MPNIFLITNHQSRQKLGFTLVEVSIVLVIIGLLVGGVLVGKDLIFSAQVSGQISQIQELQTQINAFELKYNCLPGDCANATSLFGATDSMGDTIYNGNGDGIIKSDYSGATYSGAGECIQGDVVGEVSQLFLQLYLAGLSKDKTTGNLQYGSGPFSWAIVGKEYPYAKFGNGSGIFISCLTSNFFPAMIPAFLQKGNVLVIGASGSVTRGTQAQICWSVGCGTNSPNTANPTFLPSNAPVYSSPMGIPVEAVKRIDVKIDDGLPSSGNFGAITGDLGVCNNVTPYGGTSTFTSYPGSSVNCSVVAGQFIN